MIPVRCFSCANVIAYKPILDKFQLAKQSNELIDISDVIEEINKIHPISYCCKIKFINEYTE